jgi:TldD protein
VEDTTGYAHSSDINEDALKKASETLGFVTKKNNNSFNHKFSKTNKKLYEDINPIDSTHFDLKVNTLKQIDEYARKQNPNVKQVSASLNGSWEVVRIYRPGGVMVEDIRPLVRLYVSIVLKKMVG